MALVVTIVVLLILAGITITYVLGDHGIFKLAQEAKNKTENAMAKEQEEIGDLVDWLTGEGVENEEPASEDIYVSLNESTLSFYGSEEPARANADSEAHYYGNIKGNEWSGSTNSRPWANEKETVERVQIVERIAPTNTAEWFSGFKKLKEIGNINKINTTNVTTMQSMFGQCNNLTSLDVSNFNTSNVTTMVNMFYGCKNLTSLDVSKFDTAKVTTMVNMFYDCNNLTSLDVSNFDTRNVTAMNAMFAECNKLTSLNVSNFDTLKVTNMEVCFKGATT